MRHAFSTIYEREGIKAFYRGSLACSIKDGPFAGIYYLFYKNSKDFLNSINSVNININNNNNNSMDNNINNNNNNSMNNNKYFNCMTISLISSWISGLIATASTHPFEIIRARL